MKRFKIRCPYCGALATKHPASDVYGEKAEKDKYLYICDRYPKCDSYVAANKNGTPMGTLANQKLRKKRIAAHKALERLLKKRIMTRNQIYIWLQAKLGLTSEEMHIGNFGEYYCNRVIYECNKAYRNIHFTN